MNNTLQKALFMLTVFHFLLKRGCSYAILCIWTLFIFLTGGYREYVCPFYVVDLPPRETFRRSKGEPTTSEKQDKAIGLCSPWLCAT